MACRKKKQTQSECTKGTEEEEKNLEMILISFLLSFSLGLSFLCPSTFPGQILDSSNVPFKRLYS